MHSQSSKRRKIWQLEEPFHCSIIGTCITLLELRQLSKKIKLSFKSAASDYDLHHVFVHIAGDGSYPAAKLQKFLDKKFIKNIRDLNSVESEQALKKHWQTSLNSGDIAGDYWAIATHPLTSLQLRDEIYADIHMLSHISGASIRMDMEAFKRLKMAHRDLKMQFQKSQTSSQKRLNKKISQINQLTKKLEQANSIEIRYQNLKEKFNNLLASDKQEKNIDKLSNKLAMEMQRRKQTENDLKQAVKSIHSLQQQLDFNQQEDNSLQTMLDKQSIDSCNSQCTAGKLFDDNNIDLCGRCILYVGGRNNLCSHFRTLVEQANGEFIHHDGGREDGPARLNSTLSRADIVVCPLDCISHKAIHLIKKHCEINTKPLTYMPRASMSAFTKVLSDIAS